MGFARRLTGDRFNCNGWGARQAIVGRRGRGQKVFRRLSVTHEMEQTASRNRASSESGADQ